MHTFYAFSMYIIHQFCVFVKGEKEKTGLCQSIDFTPSPCYNAAAGAHIEIRGNYSPSRRFGRFFGAKMRLDQVFKPANTVNRNLREGSYTRGAQDD